MKRFSQMIAEATKPETHVPVDSEHHLRPVKGGLSSQVKYDIHDKKGKVGVVSLNKHPEGHHSVKVINLDDRARGKNVGSNTITALHKKHGKITSSVDGDTSEAAHKMWSKVSGAKKEAHSNKSGSIYVKE